MQFHEQFAAAVDRLRYSREVESEHPAQPFLNAIEENPESSLHRAVFADWLEENPQYIHGYSLDGDHKPQMQKTLDVLRGEHRSRHKRLGLDSLLGGEKYIITRHPLSGGVVALHRGVFADWLEENPQYIHGYSPTGDHTHHLQQTLDSLRGDEHPIVVRHPLSGNFVAWRDPTQRRMQVNSSDHLNSLRQQNDIAPVNVLRDGVFHGPAGVAAVSSEPYFSRPDQDGRSHIVETFSPVSGSRLNRLGRYVDEQSARIAAIQAAFGDE